MSYWEIQAFGNFPVLKWFIGYHTGIERVYWLLAVLLYLQTDLQKEMPLSLQHVTKCCALSG